MTQYYIGTKLVTAWSEYRDVELGYAVKYEDGYISWSPAATFEAAYRVIEGPDQALTFGDAVQMLKAGKRVARAGWNGKGMWLELYDSEGQVLDSLTGESFPEANWIAMKTADGKFVPWLASQTDVLEEDWVVVE